jgi:hypothetical protein
VEKSMNAPDAAVHQAFTFRNLFRRILDDTGLKASTVARELQRERSLMYKWLSGSSIPPSSYVPLLVQVVMKHSSRAKHLILANSLRAIVRDAGLQVELRGALLRAGAIEELLADAEPGGRSAADVPEDRNRALVGASRGVVRRAVRRDRLERAEPDPRVALLHGKCR